MGDTNGAGYEIGIRVAADDGAQSGTARRQAVEQAGDHGFWSDFDLIPCADGKARRVESGTFPLAHGIPARVGKLRAYGNAIVPQVAAEFIAAFDIDPNKA